jgi:hypothetical protein
VCAAGFEAAANDMTAGESAAISAIASNATIFAFIGFSQWGHILQEI